MNKGEPLKIKINNLQGALNRDRFEFLPKARTVAKKNPRSNSSISFVPNHLIDVRK